MTPIQATIVAYSGKPCTLFSVYDNDTKVLAITVEADYRRERRNDCMIITNDPEIERDGLYTEAELKDSISAFFAMQAGVAIDGKSNRLVFSDKAARANPAQSIEKDGMDASGQRYRISESITCAQIAALATCWYANTRFGTIEKVLEMADSITALEQLHHGGIWTI